jgi:diadenylate cyclase
VRELLLNLETSMKWMDVLDVALVAFIVHRVLLLIRGTRAMQMLTGLGVLGIAFFLSSTFELFTAHWLLSYFFDYLILIVIVLFQDDLRRALSHVGKNPFFSNISIENEREMIEEVSRAAARLAESRVGALIVLERETGLKNFIETGSRLDSQVRAELLYTIFLPASPIHDGAVIVTQGKIAAAGCFLPLSMESTLDKKFGTRHRAAIGITEETDAIVVVVSEESGEIHLVVSGRLRANLNENELKHALNALLSVPNRGSWGWPFRNSRAQS